jgi:glycosyltransferase involved in cell wall biosynthesis
MPAMAAVLGADDVEPVVDWVRSRQDAFGAFSSEGRRDAETVPETSAVYSGLIDLERNGLARGPAVDARRRAGRWLAALAADGSVDAFHPNPLAGGLAPESRALLLTAMARISRLSPSPQIAERLSRIAGGCRRSIDETAQVRDRLWLAQGILERFHQHGTPEDLSLVKRVLVEVAETQDSSGRIASVLHRDGPRADAATHALFTALATRIGVPEFAARGAAALADALSPTGLMHDDAASNGADVRDAILIHEALVRMREAAGGLPQIPILRRGEAREIGRRRRPLVAFLSREPVEQACPYVRVHAPLSALDRAARLTYAVASDVRERYVVFSEDVIGSADVVVIQRFFLNAPFSHAVVPAIARTGAAVIFEIDDLLFSLPDGHPATGSTADALPNLDAGIRLAQVVTATNETLARELLRRGARQVVVIPNAIDPVVWPAVDPAERAGTNDGRVVIACTGSNTHGPDLRLVLPALREVLVRHPGRVELRFWGCVPDEMRRLPGVTTEATYISRYPEYAAALSTSEIDLAVVPLADNAFNRAKSYIKWLEYGAAGIPAICSRIRPYAEVIRDGEDGYLAGADPNEWISRIESLIEDRAALRRVAAAAYRRVRSEFTVERQAALWETAVRVALSTRVPERRSACVPATR